MKKLCIKCHQEKERSLFSFRTDTKKYSNTCFECKSIYLKEYTEKRGKELSHAKRKWEIKNKDKIKASRLLKKDDWNKKRRERYKTDLVYRENIKEIVRKKLYGMKGGEFKRLHDDQNGLCKICKSEQYTKKSPRLYIDHSHNTGKVRGLLCHKCNTAIGLVNENIEILKEMIKYIKIHE